MAEAVETAGAQPGDVGAAVVGEFPEQLLSTSFFSFSFWKIPFIQVCLSKQAPGLSHSPILQPDWGLPGSGSITAQLFPAGIQSHWCTPPLCVCHFILIPPSDFKHPGPSWCCSNLVWQGRELLTWLSPKNPVADPVGAGPGAAATLVPPLVPGNLLAWSTLLPIGFFNVLYSFGRQFSYMLRYC